MLAFMLRQRAGVLLQLTVFKYTYRVAVAIWKCFTLFNRSVNNAAERLNCCLYNLIILVHDFQLASVMVLCACHIAGLR